MDLQVDARILTGEFKWNVNANISVNRNKVLELGGINDLYVVSERNVVTHVTRSGLPIGSFMATFKKVSSQLLTMRKY